MIELAVIDADSIIYGSAGACQYKDKETGEIVVKDPVGFAYGNAKRKMLQILGATEAKDYVCYLTASNDPTAFRSILYKDYKANRKDSVRPVYYNEVREYLIKHWKAEVVSGIEADDKVCEKMYQFHEHGFVETHYPEDITDEETQQFWMDAIANQEGIIPAVLCGIDKDLDQIPGLHYNYNNDVFYYVTPLEGLKNLYLQMLTGDIADNIPRIRTGWRKKKSEKAIQEASNEIELYNVVYDEIERLNELDGYIQTVDIKDQIQLLGDLLYLRKHSEDKYRRPVCHTSNKTTD